MSATPKTDTWMPLYIGDYLKDTMHLSRADHGSYLLLIMAYWVNGGPLPNDPEYLAGVARASQEEWQTLSKRLARFFQTDASAWRHERIEKEIARAKQQQETKSRAGRKGAAAKYGRTVAQAQQTHPSATLQPVADASQTDTPSPSPITLSLTGNCDDLPHIPTLDEFLKAFALSEIPEQFLREKYAYFEGNQAWLTPAGALKKYTVLVRSWWTSERAKPQRQQADRQSGPKSEQQLLDEACR
jgi:uncharacterized protein YdaU (DUF1376 family)